MSEGKITRDQVIDPGIKEGFKEATDAIKELLEQYTALVSVLDTSAKSMSNEVKSVKDLNAVQAENDKLASELEKKNKKLQDALTALSEETIKANKSKREFAETTKQEAILNDKNSGTLEKLRAQNKLLTQERDKLNLSTKEGNDRLKEINQTLDKNNGFIKDNMDKLTQQKMTVGAYSEEIKKAAGQMGIFGQGFNKIYTGGQQALKSISGIGSTGKKAFGTLKTAIASTGIGLLIIALTSLYNWFTKSAEGAGILRKVTAAFGGIIQFLTGLLTNFGGVIVNAFSHPIDTLKSLGNLIQEQLINRIKAFGVMAKGVMEIVKGNFSQGFKDMGNGALQLSTGITNIIDKTKLLGQTLEEQAKRAIDAAKKAIEISNREKEYKKMLREDEIDDEKAQVRINNLREQAIDKTKTRTERVQALSKALQEEKELAEGDYQMQLYNLETIKMKEAEKAKAGIKLTEEEKDARAQAELELIKTETTRQERSFKFKRQLLSFQQQIDEEEKEAAEKKASFLASIEINDQKEAKLKADYQKKLKDAKELGVNRLAVDKWYQSELNKIYIENDQKRLDKSKETINDRFDDLKDAQGQERIEIEITLKNQIEAYKKELNSSKLTAEEKMNLLREINKTQKSISEETEKYIENEAKKLIEEAEKSYSEKLKALQKSSALIKEDAFNAQAEILKNELESQKKAILASDATADEKKAALSKINEIENSIEDAKLKKKEDTQKAIQDMEEKIVSAGNNVSSASLDLFNQLENSKVTTLERRLSKQKSLLDKEAERRKKNGEDEKKVDEDIAKKKIELEHKTEIEKAKAQRKAAIVNKAASIVNIGINTAMGIMKTLGTLGYPLAIPFIIAAAATGALETAAVAAQPLPEIPSFKKGTQDAPGGLTMLHGGEIVELPTGEKYLTKGGIDDPIMSMIPAHTKVIPNNIIKERLEINKKTDKELISDYLLSQIVNELKKEKPVMNVNIDETGFNITQLTSSSRINYINRKFRGRV